jgi:hypothetical protein
MNCPPANGAGGSGSSSNNNNNNSSFGPLEQVLAVKEKIREREWGRIHQECI